MTPVQDTPPSPRSDDPPPRRRRPGVVPPVVFGGCLVLIGVWLLLGPMLGARHEERDFRAAVACPEKTDSTGSEDCLRTVSARIDHTEVVTGNRSASYRLYVTEADGRNDRARISGSGPKSPKAWSGVRVQVTQWRGKIRYVDFPAGRQYTQADPRNTYRLFYAGGLGLGLFGVGIVLSVFWWSRVSAVSPRSYPWQITPAATGLLVLVCAGVVAPLAVDGVGAPLLVAASAAVLVLVGCAGAYLLLRRRHRGGDDTVAVTPKVPETEQCFQGGVLGEGGDTPYGGGGYLVAGPSLLVTTPDPTGKFARRTVPATVVPQRVRPPYWTDPHGGDYGTDTLVVECRDGDSPILIVTKKENVPWILGALQPLPTTF
ncbi:hypothetical protein ABT150_09610 [Streptomyces mirabilis]|uniref:hypothetical protein n=1 Tax=Streptomyces mirabilis TaxID=68239 RepID=UPI003317A6AD